MSVSDDPGRKSPLTYAFKEVIDSMMRQMMFCLPGRIVGFNPATQLAQVECGIQRMVNRQGRTIPIIENVPVHFPGDGEWYFWHQITPGETEGLIHFSQRAIDTWIDQGGPVAPHENRMLAEDDAFFVPGVRSRPGAIPGFKNDGAGVGNYAQDTYTHHRSDGTVETQAASDVTTDAAGNVTVDAGGNVEVTAAADVTVQCVNATVNADTAIDITTPITTFNGNVLINGGITWTGTAQGDGGPASFEGGLENTGGDIVSDGVSLETHTHTDSQGGTTSSPN